MRHQWTKPSCLFFLLTILILVCALLCYHNAAHSLATREDIKALLATKEPHLLALAQQAQGKVLFCQRTDASQWERMDLRSRMTFFDTGLLWVDGTYDNSLTRFTFQSVYPEGGISLYHSPSGEAAVIAQIQQHTGISFDAIPEDGACQKGLGIDRSDFVYCERLQPGWYLVEYHLPT
ncbi:MAG: hypothetical protein J6K73_10300 [Clostridia bacterium]|nr:hypothetical protein [Clostridia bacterium]